MNKSDKILITGGAGSIGSCLLRKLVSQGYNNLHAIHLSKETFDLVQDIKSAVTWCEADVTDSLLLGDLFEGVKSVIHCAEVISFWPKEFKEMYRVNVVGSATIVNLCLEYKVDRLIYLSCIEALGKEEDSIISETTEWKDDTDHTKYAATKYLGELEAWRGKAEGLKVIIYNPALILGNGYWQSNLMTIVADMYNSLKYYPRGSIAMVDVRDLVKTIVDNLDNEKMYGQRFIVGSSNVKFKKLLDGLASHMEVSKTGKVLTGFAARVAIQVEQIRSFFTNNRPLISKEIYQITDQDLIYSFEKLNSVYNLNPVFFEETIRDTASAFKLSNQAKKIV